MADERANISSDRDFHVIGITNTRKDGPVCLTVCLGDCGNVRSSVSIVGRRTTKLVTTSFSVHHEPVIRFTDAYCHDRRPAHPGQTRLPADPS